MSLPFSWQPTGSNPARFVFGAKPLLQRSVVLVRTADGALTPFPLSFDGETFHASLGRFGRYTEVLAENAGVSSGRITLAITTDESFIVQCPFVRPKPSAVPYFTIPGWLYGSNNLKSSTGNQPKFDYGGAVGWPTSSKFYVRSDRSTHPGVITVSDQAAFLVGIAEKLDGALPVPAADPWAPGHFYTGLMLDTADAATDVVGFQLGYENAPKRYSWVWPKNPRTPEAEEYLFGWLAGLGGKVLTTTSYYFAATAQTNADWSHALRAYYPVIHQPPLRRADRAEAIAKIGTAIVRHSWNSEQRFFCLAGNHTGNTIGDIAWTGGMQVAYPVLKAGLKTNRADFVATAKIFINEMCDHAMNADAGLLKEEKRNGAWQITGWWGVRKDCCNWGDAPLHSAYLNGQAAYYLLKSVVLTGGNSSWQAVARRVVDTALRSQRADGALGMFFDPKTGDAVDYDGFQGCWFAAAAALLGAITQEPRYLHAARRAVEHYHTWHVRGELYGTPMDTHRAVDQEGNLAFIAACTELHRHAPDATLLPLLADGAAWEFSWKFPRNTAFTNQPLKRLNWSSCGGSITSTHNVSIHQMGNLVAADLLHLATVTGDTQIFSRVRDTCIWGLGTFNRFDGEFGFGRTGEATEQFFYTDGLVLPWHCSWDGGVWDDALSWASACVLMSCADDIPDSYFE